MSVRALLIDLVSCTCVLLYARIHGVYVIACVLWIVNMFLPITAVVLMFVLERKYVCAGVAA